MKQLNCNNARELMAKIMLPVTSVTQHFFNIYGKSVDGKTYHEKKYRTSCQSLSFISESNVYF